MSGKRWAALAVLTAAVAVPVISVGSGSAASPRPCTPAPTASGNGYWTASGDATWTAQGLRTSSRADPNQPNSVSCGGASVSGFALPTTDPSHITALSFDFLPDRSGNPGGSPRLVVCFNDGNAGCSSNASLIPSQWTANTWTHVDGFATGPNASWSNSGGTCGGSTAPTWGAIVACHPGASVTLIAVINDSGWLYPSGEQIVLNNLRVNNVYAHASPPAFGQSAEVVPTTGSVQVKRRGSHRFRTLKTVSKLPFGSIVNATGGHLQVIAARSGHHTESGEFYDGSFRLTQGRDGVVQAALTKRPSCPSQPLSLAARIASGAPHVFGHVKGKYRTRGHYGSASVSGTIWLTEERCTGTYFHVVRGVLSIRDFTLHKHVILRAGHSYLAPNQPPDTFDHDGDYNHDKSHGLSGHR